MPPQSNRNSVTWKGVIWFMSIIVAMMTAGFSIIFTQHTYHPHAGTITTVEFDRIYTAINHRLDRIEAKLDRIIERE